MPLFPPLPGDTDEKTVEEIRRTVVVMGLDSATSAQDVMDTFATGAGEVKYFRQGVIRHKGSGDLKARKKLLFSFNP